LKHLKTASRVPSVGVWELALLILIVFTLALGCGKSAGPPSDGRLAIENIAKWRQLYLANHGRKPPPDEAAFVDFIDAKMKERGEPFNRETFLLSPRDGQSFVIRCGKDSANLKENDITVHEREGYGGKVLVAYENGRSSEIDAAELPSRMAAKP
jgi:hypothetical protein